MIVQQVENILAHLGELHFNHVLVCLGLRRILGRTLLVFLALYKRDDTPGGSPRADNVLESDRKNVALVLGQLLLANLGELSNVLDHFYKNKTVRLLWNRKEDNWRRPAVSH